MTQISQDLVAEMEVLHVFLQTLAKEDWRRETAFMSWTPWDVIAHLHLYDLVALLSLEDEEAFAAKHDQVMRVIASGGTNRQLARETFGDMPPEEIVERWQAACRRMAARLGESDPARRLRWFGPDMGLRMFTTARFMETWAHGQAIYDLVGVTREPTDRIQHVAVIGVKTFGWTFVNRGLPVPSPAPFVRLRAPSGAVWEWNEASGVECVSGDALDFCQVVTQVRNVADTGLDVRGDVARRWMANAQCFAGPPVEPPKPGVRARARPSSG